jgi:hypothetical protein
MGRLGGCASMAVMAEREGRGSCGCRKQSQGNQTAQEVRPMPRNQSKPQKPDRPCVTKRPKSHTFRKSDDGKSPILSDVYRQSLTLQVPQVP